MLAQNRTKPTAPERMIPERAKNATRHAGHVIERRNIAANQSGLLERMSDQMDDMLALRRQGARE